MQDVPVERHFLCIAIASSAGGVSALLRLISTLPGDFPVPIVIVQHLDPRHHSMMPEILQRRTALHVKQAVEGDLLQAGTVFFAPPGQHLLVNVDGTLSLSRTELVHFVRPSADLLFESVAACFGPAAIAVVLTGTGVDGATGVTAIKERGGTVIVQSEQSAEFSGMPNAAILTGSADYILPLEEIAGKIIELVASG